MRASLRSARMVASQVSIHARRVCSMRLTYERHVVSSIALEERREDSEAAKSSPKHSVPLSYRHREGTKRGDLPLTQPGTLVRCSTAISSFHRRRAGSVLHPPPPAMPSFPQFNPTRIRSYIFRLPLCTRGILAAIVGLYAATIPFPWLREFGQLEPAKMNFTQSMFFTSIRRAEPMRMW
jgi:hypothetical protein